MGSRRRRNYGRLMVDILYFFPRFALEAASRCVHRYGVIKGPAAAPYFSRLLVAATLPRLYRRVHT